MNYGLLADIGQFIISSSTIKWCGTIMKTSNNNFQMGEFKLTIVKRKKLLKLKLINNLLFGIFHTLINSNQKMQKKIPKLFFLTEDIK